MQRHRRIFGDDYTPKGRREAAIWMLALGDPEAIILRRLVWATDGTRWVHTAEVRQLASEDGFTVETAATYFDLHTGLVEETAALGTCWTPDDGGPPTHIWEQEPADGTYWLPYSATAAAIDEFGLTGPSKSLTWSDQVKKSQTQSEP
jgi:hypothetical protein